MNPRVLPVLFTKPKQGVAEFFRSFHGHLVLNQGALEHSRTKKSLFLTNLPKRKNGKKPKIPKGPIASGHLVIECKHANLNHYSGMTYGKFDTVPLASKGWHDRRSKGDYFSILPSSWHPAFVAKEDLPDTFEELGISEEVIKQLHKINVTYPTVIQAKAITHLLKGENLFVSGECGSGKTISYLIALIENVLKWKKNINNSYNSPIGIIFLPTRELAIQVGRLLDKLADDLEINTQTLIGGNIKQLLLHPEMVSVDILACTLNVFLRHLETKLYSTEFCKHVVIDEADSFIDESFISQTKLFMRHSKLEFTGLIGNRATDKSAQICFASATVPKQMEEELFSLIQGNDMKIVSTPYLHKTLSYAKQEFKRVSKPAKPEELLKLVKQNIKTKTSTLIFSNKKETAVFVWKFLKENGIDCGLLATKIYAEDRLEQYRDFEGEMTSIVSCTDLASRGLSFQNVKHVINYEFPTFMIDYIHRSGRTGRLGQGDNCKVTSLISSEFETRLLRKIELAVRMNSPLPSISQNRVYNSSKNMFQS